METAPRRLLKADLHVHTRFSVLDSLPVLGARDCYSEPWEVYELARARGMDVVTFTDHDTIEGCLDLLSERGELPDFFISVEASTRDPRTGCRLHVSAYGIDERRHREIQYLRGDVRELLEYLERESIPASLNHLGSSLVSRRPGPRSLLDLLSRFPLLETRNGAQRETSNALARRIAALLASHGCRVGETGGSDAHTRRRIGWAWTEAEAVDRETFLQALRSRAVNPGGSSGRLGSMMRDVHAVVLSYYKDVAWNGKGHFTRAGRGRAIGCSLLSLPLHLVALPATGTIFRQMQVGLAVGRVGRQISLHEAKALRADVGSAGARDRHRPPDPAIRVSPGMTWIPRPESEEV